MNLLEWDILRQEWQRDGNIHLNVVAVTTQAPCPHCQQMSGKIHDRRARKKGMIVLNGRQYLFLRAKEMLNKEEEQ